MNDAEAFCKNWLKPDVEAVQARHRARLADLYAGRPVDQAVAVAGPWFGRNHGLLGVNQIDMLKEPQAWLADVLSDMAARAAEAADEATFKPLVIEFDCLGVHYIDAVLGQRAFFHEGQSWADTFPGDLTDLALPDLRTNEVFQASMRLARLAVEVSWGRLLVAGPVLSCPINIGMNLFGQRLLEGLLERPAAARHALGAITDAILACTKALLEIIPPEIRVNSVANARCGPPGFGQIDGCATQLLSPEIYDEFFAPLDEEILSCYPNGGMIHLCGRHDQHISTWRRMQALRSVQINDRATDDFEAYYDGLRPDQIIYVAPNAKYGVDRIIQLTRGRRVVLECPLKAPIRLNL